MVKTKGTTMRIEAERLYNSGENFCTYSVKNVRVCYLTGLMSVFNEYFDLLEFKDSTLFLKRI